MGGITERDVAEDIEDLITKYGVLAKAVLSNDNLPFISISYKDDTAPNGTRYFIVEIREET